MARMMLVAKLASEDSGVLAHPTGVLAHGDIARIVVPVFDPPVCPDGGAGGATIYPPSRYSILRH